MVLFEGPFRTPSTQIQSVTKRYLVQTLEMNLIRKVHFRDRQMIQQIEDKVVNRLRKSPRPSARTGPTR